MKFKIVCSQCKGHGQVEAPDWMLDTLKALRKMRGATSPRLAVHFPDLGVTSINNRLEELRRLGRVRRERVGKAYAYYVV